jgi:hypothetical protein
MVYVASERLTSQKRQSQDSPWDECDKNETGKVIDKQQRNQIAGTVPPPANGGKQKEREASIDSSECGTATTKTGQPP